MTRRGFEVVLMRMGYADWVKRTGLGALSVLGLVGLALTWQAPRIDDAVYLRPLFGNLLVFIFWWIGLLGWGRFFSQLLTWPSQRRVDRVCGAFALGSLFAYLCVFPGMAWVGAGMSARLFAVSWTLSGALLGARTLDGSRGAPSDFALGAFLKEKRGPGFWLAILAVFSVVLRMLESVHLSESGDPYVCYLTAMRLWFDARGFAPFLDSPIQFLASAWDCLNQWGNFFFATAPGEGLAEAQRFAQWVSSGVGYGGLVAVLASLFLPDLESSHSEQEKTQAIRWAWVAVLAGLSVPCLRWTFALAKNDTGVCFWALSAWLPLRLGRTNSWRPVFVSGLLLGAAVIAKPTAVIFALVLSLFFVRKWICSPGSVLALVGGGLLAAAPILLRNGLLTGNPFYPWLNNLFPNGLAGPNLAEGFSVATNGGVPLSLGRFLGYVHEVIQGYSLNFLSLIWLAIGVSQVSMPGTSPPRVRWDLFWVAWGASLLFCATLRKSTEIRYLGPALPVLAGLGVLGVRELLRLGRFRIRIVKSGVLLVTGVYVVIASGFPVYLLLQLNSRHFTPPFREVLGHFGGPPKQWLRRNAKPTDAIASLGDNEVYHTLPLRMAEMRFHPGYDRALSLAKTPADMIRIMKAQGIRYYYRAPVTPSPASHRYLFLLDEATRGRDACARYAEGKARIYDVDCL